MRAARGVAAATVASAVVLLLAGCFGPGEDELIKQASADFGALVDQAAAADVAVLHTLDVEKPAVEACDAETDDERTVFVAAGTIAVQADSVDERELVEGFELSEKTDDEKERWTEVRKGLETDQRAWVDPEGITASVTVDEGLLVVAVFSPCR
ncbi:hypothetical protein BH11ACT5_BH11ACT5_10800 [soil metagenome]